MMLHTTIKQERLTGSPKVCQNDLSISVTTLPGDSGVPRWSSLDLADHQHGKHYGISQNQKLPRLCLISIHQTHTSQVTYLPEAANVASDISWNASIFTKGSLTYSHMLAMGRIANIPKCGGGFQMRLLCDVNAVPSQPPDF